MAAWPLKEKNSANVRKHGVSFRTAARVFFDYDRIELYDEENSIDEDRYDTIGDTAAGMPPWSPGTVIGNVNRISETTHDILFVVYTERKHSEGREEAEDVIRLISARLATSFERGLYYGKYE